MAAARIVSRATLRTAQEIPCYPAQDNYKVLPLIQTKAAGSMTSIANAQIASILDFDHGEGWVTFSWLDENGIDRSLTIDADGHCSREMPIRSGTGVSIVSVHRDHVRLRFTDDLASKLELDHEVEFAGIVPENTYADLLRLADYF